MHSGETLAADLIVLATGYKGQEHLVRKLFGDEVAARVGPIWGFGDEQELRNMFARTPQPGLWFIAGSLAQCRIDSKYLGAADQSLRDRLAAASTVLRESHRCASWRPRAPNGAELLAVTRAPAVGSALSRRRHLDLDHLGRRLQPRLDAGAGRAWPGTTQPSHTLLNSSTTRTSCSQITA